MKPYSPSPVLAVGIIATQLLGPTALWAAEQRGIRIEANRQIIVSALNGDQLTLQRESGSSPLQFREVLAEGARVTTGVGTTAELLIGNRAVVAMGNGTTAQVRTMSTDQTTIQVTNGTVRVAAAASAIGSQGLVTVQTPTSQVQTRGGIVRVQVDAPVGKVEHGPNGAQAYQVSYTGGPLLAAVSPSSDLIHVEEGIGEIPGVGPTGGLLTLQAGQRVAIQAGRAGSLVEAVNPGIVTTGILATTGHTQTPKEGRDYLVALQVDQATKLGQALTGAAETGQKDSEKKSDTKNVINGATGGVTLQNNLVSILFGSGSAANLAASGTFERSGAGHGTVRNNNNPSSFIFHESSSGFKGNGEHSLLVFTRKDPIESYVKPGESIKASIPPTAIGGRPTEREYKSGDICDVNCLESATNNDQLERVIFSSLKDTPMIQSNFLVKKELILIGGSSNRGHGGIAPEDTLILRGVDELSANSTNEGLRSPARRGLFRSTPPQIVEANSTISTFVFGKEGGAARPNSVTYVGGTLGQFSSESTAPPRSIVFRAESSYVDGAITATTDPNRPTIRLKGGVSLDQGTIATIGTTAATDSYFKDLPTNVGRTFDGSLLSMIKGPDSAPTVLTMQDRMLGVYDGSEVKTEGGNKALLSVLDAKLKGPGSSIPLIDIAAGTHFTLGAEVASDGKRTVTESPGSPPNVTVTSAIVTRSTIPLDGALVEASAPLFALTKANMTTTNHFADLAGNQTQSLNLNGALVALSASKLVIDSGHLLNLNNATAAITGYLFSLNNGSTIQLSNGSLFSLNSNSSLTLNGDAFGVFGSGTNTLKIDNNLCGAGAACGALVNSAGQAITLQDGTALKVAGVTQNVVLPNGFNVFAQAPNAGPAKVQIDANDALFKVDGTSTLTINGTKVH